MGGMCDEKLSANTSKEMMDAGWDHIKKAHPEMAAGIEKMPKDDPKMKEWEDGFNKTWEETPNI